MLTFQSDELIVALGKLSAFLWQNRVCCNFGFQVVGCGEWCEDQIGSICSEDLKPFGFFPDLYQLTRVEDSPISTWFQYCLKPKFSPLEELGLVCNVFPSLSFLFELRARLEVLVSFHQQIVHNQILVLNFFSCPNSQLFVLFPYKICLEVKSSSQSEGFCLASASMLLQLMTKKTPQSPCPGTSAFFLRCGESLDHLLLHCQMA